VEVAQPAAGAELVEEEAVRRHGGAPLLEQPRHPVADGRRVRRDHPAGADVLLEDRVAAGVARRDLGRPERLQRRRVVVPPRHVQVRHHELA
jgi:hypothetical protein